MQRTTPATTGELAANARLRTERLTPEQISFEPESGAYHRTQLAPGRRTILYCAAGSRSAPAADALRQFGSTNIAHVDPGIKAWTGSGREVVR